MKAELIINAISLALVAISGLLLWYQIRANNEWARRKTTYDMLTDVVSGDVRTMRRLIDEKVNVYQPAKTYVALKESHAFSAADERNYVDFLNYFEHVFIAVKHGILDADIVYEVLHPMVSAYCAWACDLIAEKRKIDPTVWVDLTCSLDDWERKSSAERKTVRKPPKRAFRGLTSLIAGAIGTVI